MLSGVSRWRRRATLPGNPTGVVTTACLKEEAMCNTGSPFGEQRECNRCFVRSGTGPAGVAERPVVVMKPGNSGGAKGPWFKGSVL